MNAKRVLGRMGIVAAVMMAVALGGCNGEDNPGGGGGGVVPPESVVRGTFIDPRDQTVYKTVKIKDQMWMAENLNYVTDSSFCYNNDSSKCAIYGRLYFLNDGKSACVGMGGGWRLPTLEDWDNLIKAVGGGVKGVLTNVAGEPIGYENGGRELKSANYWSVTTPYNYDTYGFSALPGGWARSFSSDAPYPGLYSYEVGSRGHWWAAIVIEDDNNETATITLIAGSPRVYVEVYGRNYATRENDVNSVRCVVSG